MIDLIFWAMYWCEAIEDSKHNNFEALDEEETKGV